MIVLVCAVLGASACGGSHEHVVAFVPIRPPSGARPAREHDPPCSRSTTAVISRGRQPLNAAIRLHYIGVVNRGTHRCALDSRLVVTVLPQSRPIGVSSFVEKLDDGESAPERLALLPGETADATIDVAFGCYGPHWHEHEVQIRIAAWNLRPLTTTESVCGPSAVISVGQLVTFTPHHEDNRRWPLTARLVLPHSVRRGETLRYAVQLTNTSAQPFRFRSCPEYVIETRTYVLNCRRAGPIPAGAHVRFAIEQHVPRTIRGKRFPVTFALFGGATDFDLDGTVALRD